MSMDSPQKNIKPMGLIEFNMNLAILGGLQALETKIVAFHCMRFLIN